MNQRLINIALVVCIILTMALIQLVDASDLETEMTQERREWMHAFTVCHRSYGPQTQPEYDDAGRMVCVGARGQKYGEVK